MSEEREGLTREERISRGWSGLATILILFLGGCLSSLGV
jgi:hypothetical protein